MKNRLTAIFLTVSLLLTLLPAAVLAEDAEALQPEDAYTAEDPAEQEPAPEEASEAPETVPEEAASEEPVSDEADTVDEADASDKTTNEDETAPEVASGTYGTNITWVLTGTEPAWDDAGTLSGGYTLTISGSGSMQNPNTADNIPWKSYASGIVAADIASGITNVGSFVFYGCSNLTSVTLPDSITTISFCAFEGCTSLGEINIPTGVNYIARHAFYGCSNLTSLKGLDSLTSKLYLGDAAFKGCTALADADGFVIIGTEVCDYTGSAEAVMVPDGITRIGASAFAGCSTLTAVTLPETLLDMSDSAFQNCTALTSISPLTNVTGFGQYAFAGCTNLKDITIPDNLDFINSYVFDGCSSLTSVSLPSGLRGINPYAFRNCTSLTSVTIADGPDMIGAYAFYGCSSLTSIAIPASVANIYDYAFTNCSSLASVTIENSAAVLGSSAFRGCICLADEDGFVIVLSTLFDYTGTAAEVVIPDTVTVIDDSALYQNTAMTALTIPDSVVTIKWGAFEYCSNLSTVHIGTGVQTIYSAAFAGCSSLTSVYITDLDAWCRVSFYNSYAAPLQTAGTIYLNGEPVTAVTLPDDVTTGTWAFNHCTSLKTLTLPSTTTRIMNDAFYGCNGLESVTIPDGVTSIGMWAFEYCRSLTSVVIPESLTSFGRSSFYRSALTDIYYKGTPAQWSAITFESDTAILTKATVHYHWPNDHTRDAGTVITPATYEADGAISYTCTVCGETWTEAIPKLQKAAPTCVVSVKRGTSSRKVTITGTLNEYADLSNCYEVTGHGILYITTSRLGGRELTSATSGRTRVTFGAYKDDGSFCYTFRTSSVSTTYAARTWITYLNENGNTCCAYSDTITFSYNTLS